MRLNAEKVLVTGSTAGIGKHVALMCAKEGARVAVHGRDRGRGEAVLRGTLTTAAWLTREALKYMLAAGRGSIVNVSSRQAERASPGNGAYAAAKGGMNALTRAVAVDYGRRNIRCNALSVGYVINAQRDAGMSAERRAEIEAMHITRPGHPDDIAHAVVFLASRESEFITGALIPVDGGATIARGKVLG